MRPVERGECPTGEDGQPVVFADYKEARPHLLGRIGSYCSFCEVEISVPIDVEHIRHKHRNPSLERSWDNLLLACKNCNSTKDVKVDTAADVEARLWPHTCRTFDVFRYLPDGVVQVADITDPALKLKAEATAEMVGLLKRPNDGLTRQQIERATDRRYQKRSDAWRAAADARDDLRTADSPELRRTIVRLAKSTGFWSVWMTVFAGDAEMRREITTAFAGTAVDRFEPLPMHCGARDVSAPAEGSVVEEPSSAEPAGSPEHPDRQTPSAGLESSNADGHGD